MEFYFKAAEKISQVYNFAPTLFIGYFILINLFVFILYFADKQKAKKHRWRIPESTLLWTAFLGGSFGAFFSMRLFRHKTQHPKFYITIPIFMILHLAVIITIIIGISRTQ